MDERDVLSQRFEALTERQDDSDWAEVARRGGLTRRRWIVATTAAVGVAVLLAVPTISLGLSGGLPFFQGKRAPERVVKLFGDLHRGYPRGMDPGVIEAQTRQVLSTKLSVGRAVLWVAPTRAHGFCELLEYGATSGGGCAQRPFGLNLSVSYGDSMSSPSAVVNGATDLRDAARVEIDFLDGEKVNIPFVWVSSPIDAGFFVYGIPQAHWATGRGPIALVVRASDGRELTRTALRSILPPRFRDAPKPPYKSAGEQPLQQQEEPGVALEVYRSGLVDVRFTEFESGPYAFLRPKVEAAARHTVTVECGHVSYDAGRWSTSLGGTYAEFSRDLQAVVSTPKPPYDVCSVRGHYGRRWDEHVGYHNAVEVPFTAEAQRFFAEQAAARRLAYFVRSPKIADIRRALKTGGTAPSSADIASRFDESVVPLSARDETPPPGKVGVWSDRAATIVAAEEAADGRRMWVELDHGRRGQHNLDSLAFVF